MIEQADGKLVAWVKEVLGDVEVTLESPDPKRTGPGVSCYLISLIETPQCRVAPSTTYRFELRYLITAYAAAPAEAHGLLGSLVLASLEHPAWVRDLEPIPADVWGALGVAPQPALALCVPVQWEKTRPFKRVRKPLEVVPAQLGRFEGVLLGPGDLVIPNASLTLPDLQLTTTTDRDGRFCFPAIPSQPRTRRLLIWAKGQGFDLSVEQPSSDEQEVEIRLEL